MGKKGGEKVRDTARELCQYIIDNANREENYNESEDEKEEKKRICCSGDGLKVKIGELQKSMNKIKEGAKLEKYYKLRSKMDVMRSKMDILTLLVIFLMVLMILFIIIYFCKKD